MNYNKRQFTKEQFLDLPLYPHAHGVPANTDFLLGSVEEVKEDVFENVGLMARQKDSLLRVLEEITKANVADLKTDNTYNGVIKVKYWRKLKDGNVSERGGHITMKSIIGTMVPELSPVPVADLSSLVPDVSGTITVGE